VVSSAVAPRKMVFLIFHVVLVKTQRDVMKFMAQQSVAVGVYTEKSLVSILS